MPRKAVGRNRSADSRPVKFSRESEATQRLAEVGLCCALLLRCQCGSRLAEVGVCGLDEGLDGCYNACCGLALEGFGFEGLDDKVEDLGGL